MSRAKVEPQAGPVLLPSLYELAEVLLRFELTQEELSRIGLEEGDFRRQVMRLRLHLANAGLQVS